jgi:hypothetical protein
MSEPAKKWVVVPFNGGEARLPFTKVDGLWVCSMPDETMTDLQVYLSGEPFKERVRWVDIPNLGDNDGSGLSSR